MHFHIYLSILFCLFLSIISEFNVFHSDAFGSLANRLETMALGRRGSQNEIVNTDSGKFGRNVHKMSAAESCVVGVARIFFTPTLRSIKLCLKVPRQIDPIMFLNFNKHL